MLNLWLGHVLFELDSFTTQMAKVLSRQVSIEVESHLHIKIYLAGREALMKTDSRGK